MLRHTMHRLLPLILVAASLASTGCVRRTIRITSEPPGALVWLNHREVGRTPVEVEFTHYGTYDLLLKKNGFEPLIGAMPTGYSVHGTPGIDLALEVLPVHTHDLVEWHIDMVPRDNNHAALLDRAAALRAEAGGHNPEAMAAAGNAPEADATTPQAD
ncbi:MAG: PEGA domain-containing protein [Phycisphaerales bacterium]|jgi:hypothetical protein|nr:PEGA domain-containing protein [Phycisphaerales bacterium]